MLLAKPIFVGASFWISIEASHRFLAAQIAPLVQDKDLVSTIISRADMVLSLAFILWAVRYLILHNKDNVERYEKIIGDIKVAHDKHILDLRDSYNKECSLIRGEYQTYRNEEQVRHANTIKDIREYFQKTLETKERQISDIIDVLAKDLNSSRQLQESITKQL